jgi:DNA-binding transcriptional LysR family regulator
VRNLDLDVLRTFVAIVEREGFAPAAEQVRRTQSAVTQQMQRLEEDLRVPLFHKVGRAKKLTEHGVRMLEYARRMLALNDEALESLAAFDLRGPLRLGTAHDAAEFILPNLLARFAQLYPNVQIEVHPARSAHLLSLLKRGEIEIALIGTIGEGADPGHPSVHLRTSPLAWMCAANYVWDPAQPLPLVLPDEPSRYRKAALESLEARGIPWRIRHVSASLAFSGLRAAVRAGLGVTARVIEMLTPELRVLGEAEGLPRLPDAAWFLYLRDERVSVLARRLFDSTTEGSAPRGTRARPAVKGGRRRR